MVSKYWKNPFCIASLFCILILYCNFITKPSFTYINSIIPVNEIDCIKGKIGSSPVKTSNGKYYNAYLILEENGSKKINSSCSGKVQIFIPSQLVEAYFPGKLYTSLKKQNEHIFETGGEYTFSGHFINHVFYVSSCIHSEWEDSFFGNISYFRCLCRIQFKRLMYSWKGAGGLLLALLCGAKEYTEKEVGDNFRNAGLSHILALSGMHLSMFSGIAMLIGKKTKRKKLSFIIRVFALIIFVWFAGFSPSLLRAFIFSILIITASIANVSKPDLFINLCICFLIQICISPSDIYNIGFILSYGALAGILLFTEICKSYYERFLPDYFSNSLSASTSAQIFTAPVSLSVFGTFSPIGIIATTIISPVITLFIYTGLVLIILSLIIPILAKPSGFFMNILYTIIKYLVKLFSIAPVWRLK